MVCVCVCGHIYTCAYPTGLYMLYIQKDLPVVLLLWLNLDTVMRPASDRVVLLQDPQTHSQPLRLHGSWWEVASASDRLRVRGLWDVCVGELRAVGGD